MNIRKQTTSYLIGVIVLFTGNAFALHQTCPSNVGYPSSNGCSLDGIRPGGFPYFDQAVKINYKPKKGGFNIKASFEKDSNRSSLLINPENNLSIGNTKYKLRKVKVRDGVLISGKLKIRGIIEDLGITKKDTLMTADLEGAWSLSGDDNQLFGFNTTNIVCHDAFAMYCTQAESVYLALNDAINTGGKNINTTGVAVTTIPLPAAVWLFGSGLIGMAVMARRKSTNQG